MAALLRHINCRNYYYYTCILRRIVRNKLSRRIVQRRIVRSELSAPNCPAPNCPAPNCPAPNFPDTPTQHSPIPVSWHAWHGILWYYFLPCATIMNALFCTTSGHAQRACSSASGQEEISLSRQNLHLLTAQRRSARIKQGFDTSSECLDVSQDVPLCLSACEPGALSRSLPSCLPFCR